MKIKALFLIALICFTAFVHLIAQPSEKHVNTKALIDSLDKALFRTYIFPEKTKIMADHLKSQLKKGVYKSITDPKQLAGKIETDIQSVHHDGHLRVHYDPEFAQMLSHPR